MNTCSFSGCRRPAEYSCKKLFGDRAVFVTCEEHKPDAANRPAALKSLPFFYSVAKVGQK